MNRWWVYLALGGLIAVGVVFARKAESGQAATMVRLQQSNPGATQIGHSNINGTARAGQFVGGGGGLTGLSASNVTTGTLPDAQLSANVARRNAANTHSVGPNIFSSGFVGVGRSTQITGAEMFGIQGPAAGFGGMYISSTGATGLPFYGYSLPGASAYHYLDGTDGNKWKFQMPSALAMVIKPTGEVGLGNSNPTTRLDVTGTATMTGIKMTTAPTAGYLLTSDASGNGSWQAPTGSVPNPLALSGATTYIIKGTNTGTGAGNAAIIAEETATSGNNYGLYATANSDSGMAILGWHQALTGAYPGIRGLSNSSSAFAAGVDGNVNNATPGNSAAGVHGWIGGPNTSTYGVFGEHNGSGAGVYGLASNINGIGVKASNTSGGDALYAGVGTSGRAAVFQVTGTANPLYALDAIHAGTGIGIKSYMTGTGMAGHFQIANAANGSEALHAATNGSGSAIYAQTATGGTAIFAIRTANGNKGWLGGLNEGGWAESATGDGFIAKSSGIAKTGLYAEINSTNGWGVYGNAPQGTGTGIGVFGTSSSVNGAGGYFRNTGGGVACRVDGNCKVNQLEIVGAGDVAERFEVTDSVKPGQLVAIDSADSGKLRRCTGSYNPLVAGVVSGANRLRPGVLLDPVVGKQSHAIAMTGKVWVYCDATQVEVKPGNLLTSSDTPGYAMAVVDYRRAQGAIVGKAMTRMPKGKKGLVLALVSLQ